MIEVNWFKRCPWRSSAAATPSVDPSLIRMMTRTVSLPAVVRAACSSARSNLAGPLPDAVRLVLKALDPELAADESVLAAVLAQAQELGAA